MWLFGQMHPNIGDNLSLAQASWHSSLERETDKRKYVQPNLNHNLRTGLRSLEQLCDYIQPNRSRLGAYVPETKG
jgi:hypothetical protein